MNKYLHDMDDIFNAAHQQYEEEPSTAVWDKINAGLDKQDAEKYKKKFIGWKRVAVLLILLVSGFVLYESGIMVKRSGDGNNKEKVTGKPTDKNPVQNNTTDDISKKQDKNAINNQTSITTAKETLNEKNNIDKEVSQQNISSVKDDKDEIIAPEDLLKKQYLITDNNIVKRKLVTNQKLSAPRQTKKGVKEQGYKDVMAKQNVQQNFSPVDTINSLADIVTDNQTPLIKKTKLMPVDIIPAYRIISQSMLTPSNISLSIPDSVLSKSLAINQVKKSKNKFKPYWSVTGFASNDWAHYKLENDLEDNNGQSAQDEKEVIAKRERPEPSFSAGIMVTRQFTKNLAVKTGLIYSNTAIAINPQEIYATQKTDGTIAYKYNTSSGYGYIKPGFGLPPSIGDSLQSTEAQHSLQSLSIPLLLGYKLGKKQFSITPSAGFTANFITSAKVQTEVKDALNRETFIINGLKGLNHFYVGFMAEVNLQYNLNKRWALNVLPTFKYAISPITKGNVVKTFPYNFGIGAGITYKF